jgi:hypothetical protein
MPSELHFTFEHDGRWRVGTGTSKSGAVDDETLTNRAGNASIDTRTVRQVLRECVQTVLTVTNRKSCASRDARCSVHDPCIACRIFGSAALPSHWEFDLHVSTNTKPPKMVTSHATDPWIRRPGDDLLYTLGVALPMEHELTITWPERTDADEEEIGALVTGAGVLDAIGANTNRALGQSRCWLNQPTIDGRDHNAWVQWFVDNAPSIEAPTTGDSRLSLDGHS